MIDSLLTQQRFTSDIGTSKQLEHIALTDAQWEAIQDLFDCRRKRKHSIRGILNAVLYIVHNDTHWRMLPKNYAPWQTVYYYFDKWRKTGVWQRVLAVLPDDIRQKAIASAFVSPYPTVNLTTYQQNAPQPGRAQIHTVEAGSSLSREQRLERRYAWVLKDFLGDDDSPKNQAA